MAYSEAELAELATWAEQVSNAEQDSQDAKHKAKEEKKAKKEKKKAKKAKETREEGEEDEAENGDVDEAKKEKKAAKKAKKDEATGARADGEAADARAAAGGPDAAAPGAQPADVAQPADGAAGTAWTAESRRMLEDRVQLLVARGKSDAEVVQMLEETYGYAVHAPVHAAANAPRADDAAEAPRKNIRKGFSEAELAAQAWRKSAQAAEALPPVVRAPETRGADSRGGRVPRGRAGAAPARASSRRRRRSRSSSSSSYSSRSYSRSYSSTRSRGRSSSSSYSRSYSRSRSKSPTVPLTKQPPPGDPRRLDHDNRRGNARLYHGHAVAAEADPMPSDWHHDKFDEILREPIPAPPTQTGDYVPPVPEWFSRAGGVCIPNPRAWTNERITERREEMAEDARRARGY
ncbi:hypothetical protein M885DRAFT_533689 [Pelagophyceae sp. CCMP2097]|nr:hypothetical protein M885DRAFT_533689 [Pelagophyceae sp. CCMP2097]